MRERFEQRLFRIFAQAGYSPIRILTVLCVQKRVLADPNTVRNGKQIAELMKAAQESEADDE